MILLSVGPGPGALAAPELCRELCEAGYQVALSLGPGAQRFVGPLAFAGLAHDPGALAGSPPEASVFAPADSGTLARLACGLIFARGAPVVVAPDLDAASAAHPAVWQNLSLLRKDGFKVVEGDGGAMASPAAISAAVCRALGGPLSGLKLLVSAGGTREPIDSVRFVGNRSSGKMGRAVAREAIRLGAEVAVVAANVTEAEPGTEWVEVETFAEMKREVLERAGKFDALVMAAAVSDFTPAEVEKNKIRRRERLSLELVATEDILKEVRKRNPELFVVGFAATHGDPVAEAREKLRSKDADLIVGNDISRSDVGFSVDENEVYVVAEARKWFVPRTSKRKVARTLLEIVAEEIGEKSRRSDG